MARIKSAPQRIGAAPSPVARAPRTEQERNRHRDATQPWRRWYKTARWQHLRRQIIKRDRRRCQVTGIRLVGRHPAPNSPVVDHKIPHRGDADLFWDASNLWTVSKAWHDAEKQRQEAAVRWGRGGQIATAPSRLDPHSPHREVFFR